jgi:hypothetical protein
MTTLIETTRSRGTTQRRLSTGALDSQVVARKVW